jgi:hypothetical protein
MRKTATRTLWSLRCARKIHSRLVAGSWGIGTSRKVVYLSSMNLRRGKLTFLSLLASALARYLHFRSSFHTLVDAQGFGIA